MSCRSGWVNYNHFFLLLLILMAWTPTSRAFHHSFFVGNILLRQQQSLTFCRYLRRHRLAMSGSAAGSSSSSSSLLEVEQKFSLTSPSNRDDDDDIEQVLTRLGFQPKQASYVMVDWYYDDQALSLTTQDRWLRFREKQQAKGDWELKVGQNQGDGTTVYKEIVGFDAISTTLSLLQKDAINVPATEKETTTLDGHVVPQLPDQVPSGLLVPFARIETHRSSWVPAGGEFDGLSVDLDSTNFGYAVGEVETVVETSEEIPHARERVQSLIDKLTKERSGSNNNDNERPPVGKLEYYLIQNRPDHYKACIQSGSMRG